jgi:hypothetical protein
VFIPLRTMSAAHPPIELYGGSPSYMVAGKAANGALHGFLMVSSFSAFLKSDVAMANGTAKQFRSLPNLKTVARQSMKDGIYGAKLIGAWKWKVYLCIGMPPSGVLLFLWCNTDRRTMLAHLLCDGSRFLPVSRRACRRCSGTFQLMYGTVERIDTSASKSLCLGAATFATAMIGLWKEPLSLIARTSRSVAIGGALTAVNLVACSMSVS